MTPAELLWQDHPLIVSAGQFAPSTDKAENLNRITRIVAHAASRGSILVVLPEYASYFNRKLGSDFVQHAEPLDGPFVTRLSELAKEHSLTIIAGLVESVEDENVFSNTLVAIGTSGELLATYRKIHLFDAFGRKESDWVKAGDAVQAEVIEVSGISVGLQTCYDLRFPEMTRQLVDAGAELVVVPAQWVPGPMKEVHWSTLLQARAIENTVYVIASGQSAPLGVGRSQVIDPMGVVLASSGSEDAVVVAEIALSRIAEVRANNPALLLRRFDVVAKQG